MALLPLLPPDLQHRLQSVEAQMRHVEDLTKGISLKFDYALEKTSPGKLVAAMEKAASAVTPFVRKVVMRHYNDVGLGTHTKKKSYVHTGWLKKAINGITVRLAVRSFTEGSRFVPTLKIEFPVNMNHVAAASLNWGAVHAPHTTRVRLDLPTNKIEGYSSRPIVGKAAKKSLKKFAYTGKLSKRSRSRITAGSKFHGTQVTPGVQLHQNPMGSKKSIEVGESVRVRIPYPFFYFTQQDIGALAFGFQQELYKELGYASQ